MRETSQIKIEFLFYCPFVKRINFRGRDFSILISTLPEIILMKDSSMIKSKADEKENQDWFFFVSSNRIIEITSHYEFINERLLMLK